MRLVFPTVFGLLAGAMVIVPAVSVPAETSVQEGPVVSASSTATAQEVRQRDERPNFIIIQTDDMTVDDLQVMPAVKALSRRGASFEQALTPFALCCPSRAALMTGSYPHNNGISSNFPPTGGFVPWEKKNGKSFSAYWLQQAGYHTAHIGKYINGYGMYNRPVARVPSGWSEWYGSSDPSTYQMYGYGLNEPNGFKVYGDFYTEEAENYGTDVYTTKALEVILRAQKAPEPFMLQLAYLAPHVETIPLTDGTWKDSWADIDKPESGSGIEVSTIPPRPALRHQDLLPDIELPQDPSFNEADRSDKQSLIRNLPALTDEVIAELAADNRSRKLSLLAVDEGVAAIVAALRKTNQLDNTYIVFMGDNGYLLGQHAITYGKYFPYEPALRIPMVISGPGIERNTVVKKMAFEIDIAPTLMQLAGVTPTRQLDGRSLVGVMMKDRRLPNRTLLLSSGPQKSASGNDLPLFDGVRTQRYAWWVYEDGFEEMYDLRKDPYQIDSVAYNPAYLKTKLALIGEWNRLHDCVGVACRGKSPRLPAPATGR